MKFENTEATSGNSFLVSRHSVMIPYDCSGLGALSENGVILAGTIIPANDDSALGVLFNTVNINDNPNGSLIIHGFILKSKLPEEPTQAVTGDGETTKGAADVLKQITFLD